MSWNFCPHSSTANILKVNLHQIKYFKRKVLFWDKSCRRTSQIIRKMTLHSQISYLAGICSLLLVLSWAIFIILIFSFFIYIIGCARSHPIFGGARGHPDWRYILFKKIYKIFIMIFFNTLRENKCYLILFKVTVTI